MADHEYNPHLIAALDRWTDTERRLAAQVAAIQNELTVHGCASMRRRRSRRWRAEADRLSAALRAAHGELAAHRARRPQAAFIGT